MIERDCRESERESMQKLGWQVRVITFKKLVLE